MSKFFILIRKNNSSRNANFFEPLYELSETTIQEFWQAEKTTIL